MKNQKEKVKKKETINEITFSCVSCESKFISCGVFEKEKKEERITSCSNCCPFYSGTAESEVRAGAVEKFKKRELRSKTPKSS